MHFLSPSASQSGPSCSAFYIKRKQNSTFRYSGCSFLLLLVLKIQILDGSVVILSVLWLFHQHTFYLKKIFSRYYGRSIMWKSWTEQACTYHCTWSVCMLYSKVSHNISHFKGNHDTIFKKIMILFVWSNWLQIIHPIVKRSQNKVQCLLCMHIFWSSGWDSWFLPRWLGLISWYVNSFIPLRQHS